MTALRAFIAAFAVIAAPALHAQNIASANVAIKDWLALGPFPNQKDESIKSACPREGFGRDFLKELGGEAKAEFTLESAVKFVDASGKECEAKAKLLQGGSNGIVDFNTISKDEFKAAYAYAALDSEKAQDLVFAFGSDDSAKVWINGKLVHEKAVEFRRAKLGDEFFKASLIQGRNRIMVKVENGKGGWGFALAGYAPEAYAKIALRKELQNCEIYAEHNAQYVFSGREFPKLTWNIGPEMEKALGTKQFKARWFDPDLREVEYATKLGRYIAYVEVSFPDGAVLHRALTFCKRPEKMRSWNCVKSLRTEVFENSGISCESWDSHKKAIDKMAASIYGNGVFNSEDGAKLMSYALEMKECGSTVSALDNPWIKSAETHIALKRKLLGIEPNSFKLLRPPAERDVPATALTPGSPKDASMKPDAPAKLKEVCDAWAREGEAPFTALVARNGKIFFHEAFGADVTRDSKFEMASITKAISGILFAQFIEQGVMNPDDPIGKYLPNFPLEGEKLVTLRNCMTHTTGLSGHFEWGGVLNPWLDNCIANDLDSLSPGKVYNYNGIGFDLTGKAMEMATGKCVLRSFQENVFLPLEIDNADQLDMACCTKISSMDLAKLGQLLLNKGSYGNKQFFSPETFDKIAPQELSKFYPEVKSVYGFGLSYMTTPDPEAGKNGVPADRLILGKNIIGHGAASSSVFRIDLDHNLVIAVARNVHGKDNKKHLEKFLKAIEDSLE